MRRACTLILEVIAALSVATASAMTACTDDSQTPVTSMSDASVSDASQRPDGQPPASVESVNDVLAQWATDTYGTQIRSEPRHDLEPEFKPEIEPEPDVRVSMRSIPCDGAVQAPETGDLGHWADRWYVAHDWTEPGKLIASLAIGDIVEVDGVRLRVVGVIERLKAVDAPTVRESFKTETLLQTCADNDTNFFAVCEVLQ